jgi:hypothetical protein
MKSLLVSIIAAVLVASANGIVCNEGSYPNLSNQSFPGTDVDTCVSCSRTTTQAYGTGCSSNPSSAYSCNQSRRSCEILNGKFTSCTTDNCNHCIPVPASLKCKFTSLTGSICESTTNFSGVDTCTTCTHEIDGVVQTQGCVGEFCNVVKTQCDQLQGAFSTCKTDNCNSCPNEKNLACNVDDNLKCYSMTLQSSTYDTCTTCTRNDGTSTRNFCSSKLFSGGGSCNDSRIFCEASLSGTFTSCTTDNCNRCSNRTASSPLKCYVGYDGDCTSQDQTSVIDTCVACTKANGAVQAQGCVKQSCDTFKNGCESENGKFSSCKTDNCNSCSSSTTSKSTVNSATVVFASPFIAAVGLASFLIIA